MYVAGGSFASGGQILSYSYDGFDWYASTNGNLILSDFADKSAYGNSVWVAGGDGTNQLAYSNDGRLWNATLNGDLFNSGATFNRGEYVAFNENDNYFLAGLSKGTGGINTESIIQSTDGMTWNATNNATSVMSGNCTSLEWNGTMWVAAGNGGNLLIYSYNGLDWSASTNGNTFGSTSGVSVAWNGSMWVASLNVSSASNNRIVYSNDGINWTASANVGSILTLTQTQINGIAYGNSVWVAGSTFVASPYRTLYSSDGITWSGSTSANPYSSAIFDIIFDGTKFIAGGSGTNKLIYSNDGINWLPLTAVQATNVRGIGTRMI
jgi:ligand-binding sensor domain-containing protein